MREHPVGGVLPDAPSEQRTIGDRPHEREEPPCEPFRYFTQRSFTDYEVGAFLQGDEASPGKGMKSGGQPVFFQILRLRH